MELWFGTQCWVKRWCRIHDDNALASLVNIQQTEVRMSHDDEKPDGKPIHPGQSQRPDNVPPGPPGEIPPGKPRAPQVPGHRPVG